MRGASNRFLFLAAGVLVASTMAAGQTPVSDPLVKEGTTVKLADHTYVIPDATSASSRTSASSSARARRS